MEEWEKAAKFSNDADDLARVEAARRSYPKSGYRGAMKRVAELQEEQAKRIYIDPLFIAVNYAILGEKDGAFGLLEKACREKSGGIGSIKTIPAFDSLRSDP